MQTQFEAQSEAVAVNVLKWAGGSTAAYQQKSRAAEIFCEPLP